MEISKVIPLRLVKSQNSATHINANHKVKFQVEYIDVDSLAIVHNGVYARYAERAFSEWVQTMGPSIFDMQRLSLFFAVRTSAFEFYSPLRFEDRAQVEAQIQVERGSSVIQVTYTFSNQRKVCGRARYEYVVCHGAKLFDGSLKLSPTEAPSMWFPPAE